MKRTPNDRPHASARRVRSSVYVHTVNNVCQWRNQADGQVEAKRAENLGCGWLIPDRGFAALSDLRFTLLNYYFRESSQLLKNTMNLPYPFKA